MASNIYVPDIECDSCVKLITRKLKKKHIEDFKVTNEGVIINDEKTRPQHVVTLIQAMGYRASTEPFERKTFKERIRHYKENKKLYTIERMGLQNALSILLVLTALAAFSYIGFLKDIPEFLSNYGWWVAYLIISVTSISVAAWHYYAYQSKVTCMTGMMIGMTFGMQTGMMLGAIIGATNGFFWGAMVGMIIGTSIGVMTGKCCGVMGVMEGAMAGVMGGTMGPMITVMMFSDNILWFMPLYMLINIGIIAGLSWMLYEELVEGNNNVKIRPLDAKTLMAISVIVTIALGALMIYGPSTALINF